MGARKRNKAEQRKEAAKTDYRAVLRNCPSSPRKMRIVADLIRGQEVNRALDISNSVRNSPPENWRNC